MPNLCAMYGRQADFVLLSPLPSGLLTQWLDMIKCNIIITHDLGLVLDSRLVIIVTLLGITYWLKKVAVYVLLLFLGLFFFV
ncbi:hypothetical protein BDW69DRAFT_186042 [Aspergillus filifer]